MTSRQLRLLRAASASAVATLVAAVSHTLAGGPAPHPLLVVAVASLIVPFSAALIGSRPSRARVAATVLSGQAAFHVVFQLLGAPTGGTAAGAHAHTHHIDLSLLGTAASLPAPDAVMITGHAIAAVITTVALWHGEAMVGAIARWSRARLRRAVAPIDADHETPAPLVSVLLPPRDAALPTVVPRRGPPLHA